MTNFSNKQENTHTNTHKTNKQIYIYLSIIYMITIQVDSSSISILVPRTPNSSLLLERAEFKRGYFAGRDIPWIWKYSNWIVIWSAKIRECCSLARLREERSWLSFAQVPCARPRSTRQIHEEAAARRKKNLLLSPFALTALTLTTNVHPAQTTEQLHEAIT